MSYQNDINLTIFINTNLIHNELSLKFKIYIYYLIFNNLQLMIVNLKKCVIFYYKKLNKKVRFNKAGAQIDIIKLAATNDCLHKIHINKLFLSDNKLLAVSTSY